jgi:hypothetical protein
MQRVEGGWESDASRVGHKVQRVDCEGRGYVGDYPVIAGLGQRASEKIEGT